MTTSRAIGILNNSIEPNMTDKTAVCQRTGKAVPLSEGCFFASQGAREWAFMSVDAEQHGDYCIPIADIVKSRESLDKWLALLNQKTWFDEGKFVAFFTRFCAANGLPKLI